MNIFEFFKSKFFIRKNSKNIFKFRVNAKNMMNFELKN